jgi:cell division septum initiation protein DivIVA
MKLSSLIEKLEELVSSGTGVPATGRVLIERDKLTGLVDQIRSAIPEDIQEAQDLLLMRENLINQALLEARHIRSSSEDAAKSRVAESEITKEAEKRSEEIIEEAQRRAQRVLDETDTQATTRRAGADKYTQDTLLKLEEELSQILITIRHGISTVEVEKEPSA